MGTISNVPESVYDEINHDGRLDKEWQTCLIIPNYLVQGIGDTGMAQYAGENGEIDEQLNDDLRVCIILSAGIKIVLDGNQRIVLNDDGLLIQSFS